jgi:hypothetical protein
MQEPSAITQAQEPRLRDGQKGPADRWSGNGPMAALTATVTCTAFRAVEEATGELVPARLLAVRVGLLAALTQQMAAAMVAARWNDGDLATVGSRVGPDGRALPAKGWMALRRLGWAAVAPDGVYVPDRVRRVAEEAAARALRLAVHRRAVVHAILGTWPPVPGRRSDAEWAALRGRLPHGVSDAELRNRTRQLRAYTTDHGGRLPASLTELEAVPRIGGVVLLAAADKQLVTIQRTGPNTAVLHVKLPLTGRPAAPAQWAWHTIQLALPEHVPPDARLCVPTLRVVGGRVRVDLPWRTSVPSVPGAGHTVALGLDWGVNTLLTGTVGKLADTSTGTRVVSDGRMLRFDATRISAKLHRLRGNREQVAARRDHYTRLLERLPASDPSGQRVSLMAKHAILAAEHQHSCDRIRRLNHALAWATARWAVDQAVALGASVIFVEDLATLEARGRRNGNARLSGQVRGRIVDAIRHLAAKAGIATVTVPARGTSKLCPRCGAVLRHTPAPDRTASGAGSGPSAAAVGSPAIGTTLPPSGSSRAAYSPKRMCGPTPRLATTRPRWWWRAMSLAPDGSSAAPALLVGLLMGRYRAGPATTADPPAGQESGRHRTLHAARRTGARFPPPRPARSRASVRRDRRPRPTLTRRWGRSQALDTIAYLAPAA